MKQPKQVFLVGGIATATPEPDSELTARLTATAPCLWFRWCPGGYRTLGLSSVMRVATLGSKWFELSHAGEPSIPVSCILGCHPSQRRDKRGSKGDLHGGKGLCWLRQSTFWWGTG